MNVKLYVAHCLLRPPSGPRPLCLRTTDANAMLCFLKNIYFIYT